MMAASRKPQYFTVKEYLAMEAVSETKHEYYRGEIRAMSGAHPNHNRIANSAIISLGVQLRKRPCDIFGSDQRVRISDLQYAYPDISIVCGTPEFNGDNPPSLLNPTVLIEVLSSSTESYDRGEKLVGYRLLSSVQEVLLIAQNRCHITHYVRQAEHKWVLSDVLQLEAVIELASIDCTLALADVYAKVNFEDEAAS
jgi:Uma2 family endonuclease